MRAIFRFLPICIFLFLLQSCAGSNEISNQNSSNETNTSVHALSIQPMGDLISHPETNACTFGPSSGECVGFMTCGGGGTPNVCGCTPTTSFPSKACGIWPDNCGGYTDLGGCGAGEVCGGQGQPGICATPLAPEAKSCGATIVSNKHYILNGPVSSATDCFTLNNVSNIYFDGQGQTITAASGRAFSITGNSQNIVISNVVVNAQGGVLLDQTINPGVAIDCATVPIKNIAVLGSHFIQGEVSIIKETRPTRTCNIRIEHNQFDSGVTLGMHNAGDSTVPGIGFSTVIDNDLNGPVDFENFSNSLVLGNRMSDMVGIIYSQHLAFLRNRTVVTKAISDASTGSHGNSIFKIYAMVRSAFAGNLIHNRVSYSGSVAQFGLNTYEMQYDFIARNTIHQDIVSPHVGGADGQVALNFRSKPADNLIYKNTVVADDSGGAGSYGLKFVAASTSCPGFSDCLPERNIVDSNTFVANTSGIYVADYVTDGSLTIKNNLIRASTGIQWTGDSATLLNNTFVTNNVVVPDSFFSYTGNLNFFGNILYSDGSGSASNFFPASIAGYLLGAHNLLYRVGGGISIPVGMSSSKLEDPLFINLTHETTTGISDISLISDLSVHAESPAINNGDLDHHSIFDLNGVVRDSSPDIGAYEYCFGACVTATPTPSLSPGGTNSSLGASDSSLSIQSGGCGLPTSSESLTNLVVLWMLALVLWIRKTLIKL